MVYMTPMQKLMLLVERQEALGRISDHPWYRRPWYVWERLVISWQTKGMASKLPPPKTSEEIEAMAQNEEQRKSGDTASATRKPPDQT
jgi:hypothetical protein